MSTLSPLMTRILTAYKFEPANEGCLGGEEEFFTLSLDGAQMVNVSQQIFATLTEPESGERGLVPELPSQQVESKTSICRTVADFEADLTANRIQLAELGTQYEFQLSTDPTPPCDFEVEVYPKSRYQSFLAARGADALRPGWISGLHVHYGCKSLPDAVRLLNGLREFLPLLLAVSARSPTLMGTSRGYASERYLQYIQMQTNPVPPHVRNQQHFAELARDNNWIENPGDCWWTVRITRYGTVEVRIFDSQETAQHSAQLAALVRTLAKRILNGEIKISTPRANEEIADQLLQVAHGTITASHYTNYIQSILCQEMRDGTTTRETQWFLGQLLLRLNATQPNR